MTLYFVKEPHLSICFLENMNFPSVYFILPIVCNHGSSIIGRVATKETGEDYKLTFLGVLLSTSFVPLGFYSRLPISVTWSFSHCVMGGQGKHISSLLTVYV